jgi:hypothetical protein
MTIYFSARHYSALIRVYSETFNQNVPPAVLSHAAENGLAPLLMEKLDEAIESDEPIKDWTEYGNT